MMLQNDIKRQMRFTGFIFYIICFVYLYIKEKERKERREMINVKRILMNDAPELDIWA